jgi:hypothetical protein
MDSAEIFHAQASSEEGLIPEEEGGAIKASLIRT